MLKKKLDAGQYNLKDQVVAINRVTKVVKGGKNMSFAALVVIGDPSAGVVGYGSGKAKEVPQAIRKGIESAKKNLHHVNLTESTIPHQVLGRYGSGQVLLKPAPDGTGVIAGGSVRAVLEAAGIRNILTKSQGSRNPHTVVNGKSSCAIQFLRRSAIGSMPSSWASSSMIRRCSALAPCWARYFGVRHTALKIPNSMGQLLSVLGDGTIPGAKVQRVPFMAGAGGAPSGPLP